MERSAPVNPDSIFAAGRAVLVWLVSLLILPASGCVSSPIGPRTDRGRGYAFRAAVSRNDMGAVRRFLKESPELVDGDRYHLPIGIASRHDSVRMVELLIDAGADVDKPWPHIHASALHFAIEHGHVNVAKALLDAGAGVDNTAGDFSGRTPIFRACGRGNIEVVKLLIERGANVRVQSKPGGWTPLHSAAESGHRDVAALLLKSGADVNAIDKIRGTPLSLAVWRGDTELTKLLLASGASPAMAKRECLYGAAYAGYTDIVGLLTEAGAEVNARVGRFEQTALHVAARAGYENIVGELIENGANINAKSKKGETPLALAIKYRQRVVVDLLRKHGAME